MNEHTPPPEALEPPAALTEQEAEFLRRYLREYERTRGSQYRYWLDGTISTANNTEGI